MKVLEDGGYYKIKGAIDWKLDDVPSFSRWGMNDQIHMRYVDRISADESGVSQCYEQVVNGYVSSAVLVKFHLNDLGRKSYNKDMIIWFIPKDEYKDFYENELRDIKSKLK